MSQTNGHDLRGPILILAAAGLLHAAAISNDDRGADAWFVLAGLIVGGTGYLFLLVPVLARTFAQYGNKNRRQG